MLIPVLIAYVLYPDATSRVLAQTEVPSSITAWLIGTPTTVLAFVTWAWFTGKIHSDKELQRVIDRCDSEFKRIAGKLDAVEAELRERNAEALTTIVPTLTRALLMLGRFADQSDNTPPPKGRG